MELVTAPVEVRTYGVYQKNVRDGGGDMTRRDGSPVEYVEVYDELSIAVDAGLRRFTLDATVNGSRVAIGTTAQLRLRDWMEPDARIGADRRPYVTRKRKNVCTGFVAAPAPKPS